MIVDTSALLAVLLEEPDAELYVAAMVDSGPCSLSVANWFEVTMVLAGRGGSDKDAKLDELLRWADVSLVSVTQDQIHVARDGWRRFGRGNHPARLNYGDCFGYALAKTAGEPLLFKGNDFRQTDLTPALKP